MGCLTVRAPESIFRHLNKWHDFQKSWMPTDWNKESWFICCFRNVCINTIGPNVVALTSFLLRQIPKEETETFPEFPQLKYGAGIGRRSATLHASEVMYLFQTALTSLEMGFAKEPKWLRNASEGKVCVPQKQDLMQRSPMACVIQEIRVDDHSGPFIIYEYVYPAHSVWQRVAVEI